MSPPISRNGNGLVESDILSVLVNPMQLKKQEQPILFLVFAASGSRTIDGTSLSESRNYHKDLTYPGCPSHIYVSLAWYTPLARIQWKELLYQ